MFTIAQIQFIIAQWRFSSIPIKGYAMNLLHKVSKLIINMMRKRLHDMIHRDVLTPVTFSTSRQILLIKNNI